MMPTVSLPKAQPPPGSFCPPSAISVAELGDDVVTKAVTPPIANSATKPKTLRALETFNMVFSFGSRSGGEDGITRVIAV